MSQLQRQEFACREDALTALSRWEKSLELHHLEDLSVVEKCHYGHRGKPRLHEQPIRRSYTEHGHKLRILKIRDNIVKIEKVVKRLRND